MRKLIKKQANKKVTDEGNPNNFEIICNFKLFLHDLFVECEPNLWCWGLIGAYLECCEHQYTSIHINTPNAVFRLLQCKQFIVWITIPLCIAWKKTLKCFGKRCPFECNFLCQCGLLSLQTFLSIPHWACGRQLTPSVLLYPIFCNIVLSKPFCHGLAASNSCRGKLECAPLYSLALCVWS